jgi:hypothetical protein
MEIPQLFLHRGPCTARANNESIFILLLTFSGQEINDENVYHNELVRE